MSEHAGVSDGSLSPMPPTPTLAAEAAPEALSEQQKIGQTQKEQPNSVLSAQAKKRDLEQTRKEQVQSRKDEMRRKTQEAKAMAQQEAGFSKRASRVEATGSAGHRESLLSRVFDAFDMDGRGQLKKKDFLALGKARRLLGYKKGEWNEYDANLLFTKMDSDRNGMLEKREFLFGFKTSIVGDFNDVQRRMNEFLRAANLVREERGLPKA